MIKYIEEFLCSYQYTIQALIAIGTIGSVIISSVLANFPYKTKIRGTFSIMYLIDKIAYVEPQEVDIENKKIKENLVMIANIENIGNSKLVISIDKFFIKVPFQGPTFVQLSLNKNLKLHRFPVMLEPGEGEGFTTQYRENSILGIDPVKNPLQRFLLKVFSFKLLRWTGLVQIRAFTITSNGRELRLEIGEYLRKKLLTLINEN